MSVNRRLNFLAVVLIALTVIYCLQILSPLRLDTDAVTYLSLSESALAGKGFVYQGEATHFPVGFPLIIVGLDLLGIANSYSFVSLNIFFLSIGIVASDSIFRQNFGIKPRVSMLLCCLTLLSYVFIKHTTIPVSDIPYFGVSMLCLSLLGWFERSRSQNQYQTILLAIGLALMAISIRTIGVALLPALLWAVLKNKGLIKFSPTVYRGRNFLVIATSTILLLGFLVSRTSYFHEATTIYASTGLSQAVIYNVSYILKAWGEIAINIPASKSFWLLKLLYPLMGALVFVLVLRGLWLRRQVFGTVEIYILGFIFILFVWPYYGVRLWLPIVPLLMGLVTLACQQQFKRFRLKWVAILYLGIFAILGTGALGYSTRITFAGSKFPEVYGNGMYTQTYQLAINDTNVSNPGETDKIHYQVLNLLRRYEPRATLDK